MLCAIHQRCPKEWEKGLHEDDEETSINEIESEVLFTVLCDGRVEKVAANFGFQFNWLSK